MSARRAESNRSEDRSEKRHQVVHQIGVAEIAAAAQLGKHVQAENICLSFLHPRRMLGQRLPHGAATVDRVLDAEAVRHLVKHRVREEGVERHVISLI